MGKAAESKFERVGVVARDGNELVRESLVTVAEVLTDAGVDAVFESATGNLLGGVDHTVARSELGNHSDLIVVVGGDGSLLGVARDLADTQVPVVGVNRGGLGFLAGIAPEDIEKELRGVLAGHYVREEHFLLAAEVADEHALSASPALNDVVVHGGGVSQLLEMRVWIDDEWVYDQRGDGLIISSPTGSTAYALSAGGPIMHPQLDAIVIVPMFPHTLTSRPLVIGGASTIRVAVENADATKARASCDSQVHLDLADSAELTVRKHPVPLQLLFPPQHNFYESCRSKLDWATRLGGQN